MASNWNRHDDCQRATSRLKKNWDRPKWFAQPEKTPTELEWVLEVRSEHNLGSVRLGEIVLRGTMEGTLSMHIIEEKP